MHKVTLTARTSGDSMSEGELELAAAAKRKGGRSFQESWKELNPHLRYSEVTKKMYCLCCGVTEHTGSATLKKSQVTDHVNNSGTKYLVCCLALLYIAPKAPKFFWRVSEQFCTVRTIVRTKHEACGLKVRKIFGLADILSEVLKKNRKH